MTKREANGGNRLTGSRQKDPLKNEERLSYQAFFYARNRNHDLAAASANSASESGVKPTRCSDNDSKNYNVQ